MSHTPSSDTPLTYRDAGVDIDAGNRLVQRIKPMAARTQRIGVIGQIGGFGGLFEVPTEQYRKPVLVAGTDGVGTKLKLAVETGKHNCIGIDLVAMCVNDVLVHGAEPLFFLDYYATSRLDVDVAAEIIGGIADGCREAHVALIGGETAEMPDLYQQGDYDLAGFCVGVVEKDQIITRERVAVGDIVIGLASSGPHSNGYSLIRRILRLNNIRLDSPLDHGDLGGALLTPTKIYVRPVLELMKHIDVHGLAHVTGGGILENLPRILPQGTCAQIDERRWHRPPIFDWIEKEGNVSHDEMLRTFNCGIGMAIVVAKGDADTTLEILAKSDARAWRIGSILESAVPRPLVHLVSA